MTKIAPAAAVAVPAQTGLRNLRHTNQNDAVPSSSVTIQLTKAHLGGATSADYSGVPETVRFRDGERRHRFTVRTTDDSDNDDNESVRIGFGTLPAAIRTSTASHRPSTSTVDLEDNDGTSEWTVWFEYDLKGRVDIGDGPITATVALKGDDGPLPVTVSFGAPTYTATEGGSNATVRVELDAAPGRGVTAPLTTANVDNASAADYSGIPENVTFRANQT